MYKETITGYGTIDDTGLKKVLYIKEGARIVLIVDINTSNYLVNGSFGTFAKIVTENNSVDHIIINFDDKMGGVKQRSDHPVQSAPYAEEKDMPLFRHNCLYNITGAKGKNIMQRLTFFSFH